MVIAVSSARRKAEANRLLADPAVQRELSAVVPDLAVSVEIDSAHASPGDVLQQQVKGDPAMKRILQTLGVVDLRVRSLREE